MPDTGIVSFYFLVRLKRTCILRLAAMAALKLKRIRDLFHIQHEINFFFFLHSTVSENIIMAVNVVVVKIHEKLFFISVSP